MRKVFIVLAWLMLEATANATVIVPNPSGCPRVAFCGCGVALKVFGSTRRELWLAANWLKFPPAKPAPGMVAVRNRGGHVFYILAVKKPGVVLAYDPNSGGHKTRIHERRLAGFSVRNPHGTVQVASRHVRTVRVAHHHKGVRKMAVLNRMVVKTDRFSPI